MKQLLICGIDGRMGREVAALAGGYGFAPLPFAESAAGDAIIDFSHPDCLPALLAASEKHRVPLVLGTTGYTPAQLSRIQAAAQSTPLFLSANFSPGAYLLERLAAQARAFVPAWDCTVLERHHRDKKDRPGGTARRLAGAVSLPSEEILCVRAGTLRGIHEITLYGPEETLTLTHAAESRAVFAHGALKAAQFLLSRQAGLYGMADLFAV